MNKFHHTWSKRITKTVIENRMNNSEKSKRKIYVKWSLDWKSAEHPRCTFPSSPCKISDSLKGFFLTISTKDHCYPKFHLKQVFLPKNHRVLYSILFLNSFPMQFFSSNRRSQELPAAWNLLSLIQNAVYGWR